MSDTENPQDTTERLRDNAFPELIPLDWRGAVGGYLASGSEYNAWTAQDWALFRGNRKLPIWVAGHDPTAEAASCIAQLRVLKVPSGVPIVADMETRVDKYWLRAFGYQVCVKAGYKLWTYGAASTVFQNIAWHGYWVADYLNGQPFMYPHSDVRATQYKSGTWDSSTVKDYTYDQEAWWI